MRWVFPMVQAGLVGVEAGVVAWYPHPLEIGCLAFVGCMFVVSLAVALSRECLRALSSVLDLLARSEERP